MIKLVASVADESLRIEAFRKECLSKAIKCNSVDIISCYTKKDNPLSLVLPSWLSAEEKNSINKRSHIKYQSRTFLSILREKDFDTIRYWIEEDSGIDRSILNHIWKTYEEFNDVEHIMKRMCIFCLLKLKVDVSDVIDHFCSIEIITDELYKEINSSTRKIGSQDSLWVKVAKECSGFPIQSYIQEALRIALIDIIERTDNNDDKNVLDQVSKELEKDSEIDNNIFICKCKDICSKELQPMSLLKSMSLLNVYSSPPSKRKTKKRNGLEGQGDRQIDDFEVDTGRTDSKSLNKSITGHLKMKTLELFQENTASNNVEVDDRFKTIENSDMSRIEKRKHKRSCPKKRKDRQIDNSQVVTGHTDATSSNESITGHLNMKNLKSFEENTNSNNVEIDDRFKSNGISDVSKIGNGRHKLSYLQNGKDVEKTKRKTINDSLCETDRRRAHQDDAASGLQTITDYAGSQKTLCRRETGVEELGFSSDSLEAQVDYRVETQRMFVQQQKLKENTKYTPFNITASNVYIHSTHVSQNRYLSSDSASTQ